MRSAIVAILLATAGFGAWPLVTGGFERAQAAVAASGAAQVSSEAALALGVARFRAGDYAGAVEAFSLALRLNPNMADAYVNRAGAYFHLDDYRHMLEDADKAVALSPQVGLAWFWRGVAYARLGDDRAAVESYDR